MFSSSRTREKLLITAAMIAAVVLTGVTSKSAQAGCGHGVTSGTDRSAQRSYLNLEGTRVGGSIAGQCKADAARAQIALRRCFLLPGERLAAHAGTCVFIGERTLVPHAGGVRTDPSGFAGSSSGPIHRLGPNLHIPDRASSPITGPFLISIVPGGHFRRRQA